MALLKSTSVIGNLSATGNIIASKFILNSGDNNSLLLAGGNTKLISDFATSAQMTAANTSITNLSSGKVSKAGDTMTGPLTNTHVSTTWINSCSGKSAYNVGYGSYTGWINGYTKDGRMAISTYPGNDNKLYFIYMKNDTITAGTNSTNAAMTWDGSTNTLTAATFTGALNGNATSATKATQDGDGNVIKNTYLKLAGGTMTGSLILQPTSGNEGGQIHLSHVKDSTTQNGIYLDTANGQFRIFGDPTKSGNANAHGSILSYDPYSLELSFQSQANGTGIFKYNTSDKCIDVIFN